MKNYIKIPILKSKRSHKRHFQLLELMVAVFILLVCVAPTMRIFTSMYQMQQEIIRENQRDHLAHLVHSKIVELLYKRQVPLPVEENSDQLIALSDPEIEEELKKFAYACEATLKIIEYKPKKNPNRYLAQLVIKLTDGSPQAQSKIKTKKIQNQKPNESFYDYYIYIDAGFKANKDKDQDDEDNDDEGDEENEIEEEEEEIEPGTQSASTASGKKKSPKGAQVSPTKGKEKKK